MILIIDHYDSFTYNIYQYIAELGYGVEVHRDGALTLDEIRQKNPEAIILSPGPGHPKTRLNSIAMIHEFHDTIPMLGICLGHQLIAYTFGAEIVPAKQIFHGKSSLIKHQSTGPFQYITQPMDVMRYHSLAVKASSLTFHCDIVAKTLGDDEVMAIKHIQYPVYGFQFHPESVGTPEGKELLKHFLELYVKELNTSESHSNVL